MIDKKNPGITITMVLFGKEKIKYFVIIVG